MLVTRYSATISMFAECSTNFLTRLVFSSPLSTGRTHLLSVTRETKFIPHEQCVKHALYHLVSFFFFHLCLDRSCPRYRFPYFVRTFSSFLLPLQLITHLILVNIFDFFFLIDHRSSIQFTILTIYSLLRFVISSYPTDLLSKWSLKSLF